tara:strand:- start:1143 stop:1898 length:756 start_codon:yes stop_codon:yes gene_type:complete
MTGEKFKLPGSSYEELTKIIKAYGHFSAPAELGDVSKLVGIDPTAISKNAGFLVEVAILESGKKKLLTAAGKKLSQSLEHDMPDEIRSQWREIVSESEFLNKLISAIKIRNGMDEATLRSHIAFSAGQPKKPQVMTGARTIIDIIRAAELIIERDGKVVIAKIENADTPTERQTSYENERPEPIHVSTFTQPKSENTVVIPGAQGEAQIKININVSVDCSVADLDTLGEKLNRIIEDIKRDKNLVDTKIDD